MNPFFRNPNPVDMKNPEPTQFHGKALLKGKKCVVTGGALGIGRQISYTFAEAGAEVIILDQNLAAAEETRSLLVETFGQGKIHAVSGDVSNRTGLKESFAAVASISGGSIDVFVNNAGIIQPGRIEHILSDEAAQMFDRMIDVNLKGTYYCAAYAYPLLLKGVDPVFILIGSCASVGSEGQGGYAGTKAALRGLLGTLAREWKADGRHQAVRVGLIEPDYLEKTAITAKKKYWSDLAGARRTTVDKISDETVARTRVPLRREARLTEISEVVMLYALATYLNGEVISVSGGKTIRL
jgi:NAD(P)-dependent dehydrogenase (short-subunit alcohol dehydrogenase family)